jgi:hypothetical protein
MRLIRLAPLLAASLSLAACVAPVETGGPVPGQRIGAPVAAPGAAPAPVSRPVDARRAAVASAPTSPGRAPLALTDLAAYEDAGPARGRVVVDLRD